MKINKYKKVQNTIENHESSEDKRTLRRQISPGSNQKVVLLQSGREKYTSLVHRSRHSSGLLGCSLRELKLRKPAGLIVIDPHFHASFCSLVGEETLHMRVGAQKVIATNKHVSKPPLNSCALKPSTPQDINT